jgi:hypothetical protein
MHPGPRVDSKKIDIAVGDNDYPAMTQQCAAFAPGENPQFGRRENVGLPYAQLIGRIAEREMRMVRD